SIVPINLCSSQQLIISEHGITYLENHSLTYCVHYLLEQWIVVARKFHVPSKSDFKTIQAAIDSVATDNNQWVKIHINAGTYTEKVQIPFEKPCIFLEGQDKNATIITYDDHQRTDLSATFSSYPNNVVAAGITFKNSFDIAAPGDRN
ncbi:putative pectinesterase 10, partial [Mucuna pruriens]